jgi:hypothetical protein
VTIGREYREPHSPPEGEPRFAGARGGRPRAIRWALVSPVGAAPTASTAAKATRKSVNFIVVREAFKGESGESSNAPGR